MAFRALREALSLAVSIALFRPAAAAEQTLRDDGQPSYELTIPDGWDVTPNQAQDGTTKGVNMKRGEASATLAIKKGITQPGEILAQVKPQLQWQWKDFSEVDTG